MSPAGPTAAARPSSRVVHAFLRNPLAVSGLALFGFTLLVAVLAPALAPDTYDNQDIMGRLKPPLSRGSDGRVYLLGSDPLGRDMLSRIIYGARIALVVGVVAVGVRVACWRAGPSWDTGSRPRRRCRCRCRLW